MNMLSSFRGIGPLASIMTVGVKWLDNLWVIAFRIARLIKIISLPEHISYHRLFFDVSHD